MSMKLLIILFLFISILTRGFAYEEDDEEKKDPINTSGIWVKWNNKMEGLPEHAVVGGTDELGDLIVIRAQHEDHGLFVGKYSVGKKIATIPYYNEEHFKKEFEVLTHTNYAWINASDGRILIYGVPDRMFICRTRVNGYFIPGKLERARCFVSYGGYEYEYSDWETLKRFS